MERRSLQKLIEIGGPSQFLDTPVDLSKASASTPVLAKLSRSHSKKLEKTKKTLLATAEVNLTVE